MTTDSNLPEATPQTLDPIAFPLSGSRLIEASAGTGKTFTIALLYVRLILGHSPVAATGRLLTPRDILVVTFTEAATKELRDRIRTRLTEASHVFRESVDALSDDAIASETDPLRQIRNSYPPENWAANARALELAAESMDEAAVHTIHSWCYRMLREHAFDSGGLFNQSLETDHSELMAQVARDYWRTFVNPLSRESIEAYLAALRSPDDLLSTIRPLLNEPDVPENNGALESPVLLLEPVMAERRVLFEQVRAQLPEAIDLFRARFEEARATKSLDGQKLKANWVAGWLEALTTWAQSTSLKLPGLSDAAWHRLSPDGITEAWKKGAPPIEDPLIRQLVILEQERQKQVPRELLIRHAARWCTERFDQEKLSRAEMGFDDLLNRLDAALQSDNSGRLAAAIREQFPMALVDEFQDTDPVQYRIFDAVYRVADNEAGTGFFMIGDPKQAIYAFRGADIHTYLKARSATAGRHYTLSRNYRSAEAMVSASNRIFSFGEQHARQGAFHFKGVDGDNPLPFNSVDAKGRRDRWLVEGVENAALTVWVAEEDAAKGDTTDSAASACASEITRLLNLGVGNQAGFEKENGEFSGLRSGDIAVLVNNGREARAVRDALAERGVRSVYLSDRASVLETRQALDVLLWLQACAEPERERGVRAALATRTLDLDWPTLDHLHQDELAWESEIERFRHFRRIWREKGVLAMIRNLLTGFNVPSRLLATTHGERELTDLLHIAELLQKASLHIDGEQALIRHFAEMVADPSADSETRQVRLESDADLVQVVTVHKSKGLEYPLVFLPFASAARQINPAQLPIRWHDDDGQLRTSFKPDNATLERAESERLGEDIRKLYVALTRARYATWVGAAFIRKETPASALAYLCGYSEGEGWQGSLAAMAAGEPEMAVEPLPPAADEHYRLPQAPVPGPARTPVRNAGENWWISSYSAIRFSHAQLIDAGFESRVPGAPAEPESAVAERLAEEQLAASARKSQAMVLPAPLRLPEASERRIHRFYRGAGPGTFLHDILEWVAETGFGHVSEHPDELQALIERRCEVRGWSDWVLPLTSWVLDFIAMPIVLPEQPDGSSATVSLKDLPDSDSSVYPELEFWFSSAELNVPALDGLVRDSTLGARQRPFAEPMTLNGMFKGFIDLVFVHEGRYYVADYKSNIIGVHDDDYTESAIAEVIAQHRYDMQYAIYLLALHRLLASRLPDYDYDTHIGGAVYLFLRGNGADTRGVFRERPSKAFIESLDVLFRHGSSANEPAEEVL
ncbi:exodeoxyribonuclease V subunit beta [Marinobacter sp. BGYM27]|uniref:exodeoxyribonuclease V subunit beta n=1 Tax=Marinobacter sp. BGYM27 TaxID=2975597 RepID=UPI0021A73FCC|nr:exodeoxyribonuclease V subunit beta [Marinobacter sp. BGYM27]MDG5499186.1 exodeoxyribonuclease V subunit beta [Marinobacter sp. BGYM27]